MTSTSALSGNKTHIYEYSDISYESGKDAASFRKGATQFIKNYHKSEKLIKLERTSIEENTFDNILSELEQLKNEVDSMQRMTNPQK